MKTVSLASVCGISDYLDCEEECKPEVEDVKHIRTQLWQQLEQKAIGEV